MAVPPRKTASDLLSREDLSVAGKFEVHPPESRDERASRLRREEAAQRFGHVKEAILLGAVCVIAVAAMIGGFGPWLDDGRKSQALTILATIVSGSGTYLFTRPQTPSK